MKTKNINLNKFLTLTKLFLDEKTWTKHKHQTYKNLQDYLKKVQGISIISHRDSNTTKCYLTHSFTIFKVPLNQRGYMLPLRGKWVMMRCNSRYKFHNYLHVYTLRNAPSQKLIDVVKEDFQYYYVDHINATLKLE